MRQELSMAKRQRRSFNPEFKAEAVRLCRVGDRNIRQVAKDLDLTETALRAWVKRSNVDAGQGPAGRLATGGAREVERLASRKKGPAEGAGDTKKAAAFFAKE